MHVRGWVCARAIQYKSLVMDSKGNQQLTREIPVSSAQVLYVALSLIGLLFLVQKFRSQLSIQGQRASLSGQQTMGSQEPPMKKPNGDETAGTEGADQHAQREVQHQLMPRRGVAPLPSARDILQPLSHCTPLPSSGHLAEILSQERRAGAPIRPLLSSSGSPQPKEDEALSSPASELRSTRRVASGSLHGGLEGRELGSPSRNDTAPGLSEPVKSSQTNPTTTTTTNTTAPSTSSSPPSITEPDRSQSTSAPAPTPAGGRRSIVRVPSTKR